MISEPWDYHIVKPAKRACLNSKSRPILDRMNLRSVVTAVKGANMCYDVVGRCHSWSSSEVHEYKIQLLKQHSCDVCVCDVHVKFCFFTSLHEKSSCLDLPWPVFCFGTILCLPWETSAFKGWCLHMPVIQCTPVTQGFKWQVQACHLSILQIYPPLIKDDFQSFEIWRTFCAFNGFFASKSLDSLHDLPLIRGMGRQKLGEFRSKPPVSLVSFTSQVRNNGQCRSSSLTIKSGMYTGHDARARPSKLRNNTKCYTSSLMLRCLRFCYHEYNIQQESTTMSQNTLIHSYPIPEFHHIICLKHDLYGNIRLHYFQSRVILQCWII